MKFKKGNEGLELPKVNHISQDLSAMSNANRKTGKGYMNAML
jgi:hypothetical protein